MALGKKEGTTSNTSLVYSPHPLSVSENRQIFCSKFLAGETLGAYLVRQGLPEEVNGVLSLNGRIIPRKAWGSIVPNEGDLITLRGVVENGDTKKVLRTVLILVIAYYSAGASTALTSSGGLLAGANTAAVALAIQVGGTMLVNAMLPPPSQKLDDAANVSQASPTYAITGGTNKARLHSPLPLVLGRHIVFPDNGAKTFTEFVDDEQVLHQMFNFGLSDVDLSEIKIGTTPIHAYDKVEMEETGVRGSNYFLWSEELENPVWLRTGTLTVTKNAETAPSGVLAADILSDGNVALAASIHQNGIDFDPSNYYVATFRVAKDGIPRSSRFVKFEVTLTAGGPNGWLHYEQVFLKLDTSTGEYASNVPAGGVYAEAFVSVALEAGFWTCRIGNSSGTGGADTITGKIYPAAGSNVSWADSGSVQGSCTAWGIQLSQTSSLVQYKKTTTEVFPFVDSGEYVIDLFPGNVDSTTGVDLTFSRDTWNYNVYVVIGTEIEPTIYNGYYYVAQNSGRTAEVEPDWPTASGGTILDLDIIWLQSGTSAGVYHQRVSSPDATGLAVEITGNLFQVNQKTGAISAAEVSIQIQYKLTSSTTWLQFTEKDLYNVSGLTKISSSSRSPLRKTYKIKVSSGTYEVRIRRATPDSNDPYVASNLTWSQLRTYQSDTADYEGQKRLAVNIVATGQLQGQVANLSAIASAKIPTWNGVSWEITYSSNPAYQFLWLLRGKLINGKRAFGANLSDSKIDIDTLKAWAVWCDGKSLECNLVFDRAMNVSEMLSVISRCGRASITWATGKIGVVWDQADLPVTSVFGMPNIVSGSFKVSYITGKLADEIVIKFVNEDLDWQQDEVRAPVPGGTDSIDPVVIDLMGCTKKDQAGREALLMAAQQKYRRRTISWETDVEGLVVNRGDVCTLSHDLTQWDKSGRLVASDGTILTLSDPVTFTEGEVHYVGLRSPNNDFIIYEVAYQTGTADVIVLVTTSRDTWVGGVWTLAGDEIEPTTANGHYYVAQNNGWTDAELIEPLWPIVAGATVLDYGVTWKESGTSGGGSAYVPDPNHPAMDTVYMFGPTLTPGKKVKITDVKPLSMNRVQITAIDEDPNFYLEEFGTYEYVTPNVAGESLPKITNVSIGESLFQAGTSQMVLLSLAFDIEGQYGGALIEAGVNGSPLTESGRTSSRRFEITVPDTGEVIIRVTAFDMLGRWSSQSQYNLAYVIKGKELPPPDVSSFLVNRQPDGTREFRWVAPEPPDIQGYKIRFKEGTGNLWADMSALHQGVLTSSPFESNQVAKGTWTFAIVMIDTSGNESLSPIYIETTLGDPRLAEALVYEDSRSAGWPGVKTNCWVDNSGDLVALGTKTWDDFNTDSVNWDGYTPIWARSPEASITYVREIDLGEVLTVIPTVTVTAVGTAVTQIAHSSDGVAWSVPQAQGVALTNQWVQITITVSAHATLNMLTEAIIVVSGEAIREDINDLDTATLTGANRIGVGDIRLPITAGFSTITQVALALQGIGAGWTWKLLDKDTAIGPRILIYNSSGVLADAIIDAYVRGV